MVNGLSTFSNLEEVAGHLREKLEEKKYILLFAYNGTGKTRLSMAFKDASKKEEVVQTYDAAEGEVESVSKVSRDTLYFNAFTEDLFIWDNDLISDNKRVLKLNLTSRFFNGLQALEMENRIGPLLLRYADYNFVIDYALGEVTFYRELDKEGAPIAIKVSRGEENIFMWCFFLAVAQLAIDQEEGSTYAWVKYLYIDDPISSLDDNNVIAVASHLAQLLQKEQNTIKTVISTHHALFFNVMWNSLNERKNNPLHPYFLNTDKEINSYSLRYTNDTPFFHHVALLKQLHEAVESGKLFTYHFNILRSILEKAAAFHGFSNFSACIKQEADDPQGVLHARLINVLSHGNYSLFEPVEMLEENKNYFKKILKDYMESYRFNPELFPETTTEAVTE